MHSSCLSRTLVVGIRRQLSSGYNGTTASDVAFFKSVVGEAHVASEGTRLEDAGVDWMKKYRSPASVAVFPRSTEEVSRVLRHCNGRKIPVVPQGGKTGLVGGGVPLGERGLREVVIAMGRMRTIEPFPEKGAPVVECEAGVVLEDLDQYLAPFGCRVPLDLGAKGSCQIGGNISTNAGGTRYLRYGSLHGSVLGMEAVLADGTVLRDTISGADNNNATTTTHRCNALRKDNTGYDLKHMFIGSEGTLGIVTRVALLCPPRLPATNVLVLAASSFEGCVESFQHARRELSEILSAFEFFDGQSLGLVLEHIAGSKDPLPQDRYPFYCLVETSGSRHEHDLNKIATFLSNAVDQGHVLDGVVAQDATQAAQFWKLRESITLALAGSGKVHKYDLSISLPRMYELVEITRRRLADTAAETVGYGHLGDSNLHLNVLCREPDARVQEILEPFTYQWTRDQGGSISAEHGIGQMKSQYLSYSKPPAYIGVMGSLKKALDPNGILNPGKVLALPEQ